MANEDATWLYQQLKCRFTLDCIKTVEPLFVPSTNPCFKIVAEHQQYFCKVFQKDMLTTARRKRIFSMQQRLAEDGMSARPILFLEDKGIWIEEWVNGKPLVGPECLNPGHVELLAHILYRIHTHQTTASDVNLIEAWQRYIEMLDTHQNDWQSRAEKLIPVLERDHDMCFCHNDLHLQHILSVEEGTKVIDWEYAGVGHRAFDLCSAMNLNGFSEENEKHFIASYATVSGMDMNTLSQKIVAISPVVDFTNDLWHTALN